MNVLNFVTDPETRFFVLQVRALADYGVDSTVVSVPGKRSFDGDEENGRSVVDYLRFAGAATRQTFGDYDLVHANYGLTAPPAVLQPNLPSVLSLWGSDLMGSYGWLSKACAEHADAVVVMTDEMASEVDCACHVIPHGVDLEKFSPRSRERARETLGWDPDAAHVLFPYSPARTVKDYPRAKAVVDRARPAMDQQVELHSVTGVPHDQMPTYMNAADALLLTSRREGSPNSVKEAMACNLPVVSTDVGDVRERLADVEPSFVCESDEGLADRLVEVLRTESRSNGREAAREVSLEKATERLHGVYRSVLDDR